MTVQERPGKEVFRFWQEGPGYDRNLQTEDAVCASIDYIHMAPVRRKLCKTPGDRRWSNARWYLSGGSGVDPLLPKIHGVPSGLFVKWASGRIFGAWLESTGETPVAPSVICGGTFWCKLLVCVLSPLAHTDSTTSAASPHTDSATSAIKPPHPWPLSPIAQIEQVDADDTGDLNAPDGKNTRADYLVDQPNPTGHAQVLEEILDNLNNESIARLQSGAARP